MKCMIIFLLVLGAGCLQAQQVIPLYDKEIPNSLPAPNEEWEELGKDSILRIHAVSRPTITIYLPPKHKRNGKAVIICPGGGYRILAFGHEGTDVAKAFVAQGI